MVRNFSSTREAKEFLIDEIVREAERERIPLSEIERKMLFFSETAWSLPDIYEVSEAFDAAYSTVEYEDKIAALISSRRKHLREYDSQTQAAWDAAVRMLKKEDHYILVLIDLA